MSEFYILKNTSNGKYYSDDKNFIEPNEAFAKYPLIEIEKYNEDGSA